jgi:hypothetical protein
MSAHYVKLRQILRRIEASSALQIDAGLVMVGGSQHGQGLRAGFIPQTSNLKPQEIMRTLILLTLTLVTLLGSLAAEYRPMRRGKPAPPRYISSRPVHEHSAAVAAGFWFGGKGASTIDLPTPSAYWGFESNALDYASTNHFTTNGGTVPYAKGVRGSCAVIGPANGGWLEALDSPALSYPDTAMTIAGWVYMTAADYGGDWVLGKGNTTSNEWGIFPHRPVFPGDPLHMGVTANFAGFQVQFVPSGAGQEPVNGWSFFVIRLFTSGSNRTMRMEYGATSNVVIQTTLPLAIGDGTNAFRIGKNTASGLLTTLRVDELAIWSGTNLTAQQIQTLYNSGYGRTWTNGIGWR